MAEVNNCPEPTFPSKRLPDLTSQDSPIELKKQKQDTNPENINGNPENDAVPNQQQQPEPEEEEERSKEEKREEDVKEEEEDEDEHSIEKPVIDRKGKGIMIEEDEDSEEDDDDDDSDDSGSDDSGMGGDELSDDSDFIDDPLAEVNMDNILPSRTRRKTINPGAYLATDLPEDDSDDESDDPDA